MSAEKMEASGRSEVLLYVSLEKDVSRASLGVALPKFESEIWQGGKLVNARGSLYISFDYGLYGTGGQTKSDSILRLRA